MHDENADQIRSLLRVPDGTLEEMVEEWHAVRTRSLLATTAYQRPADAKDLLDELVLGTAIAQEVLAGRWCVVADLFRTRSSAAASWSLISTAIGMTD